MIGSGGRVGERHEPDPIQPFAASVFAVLVAVVASLLFQPLVGPGGVGLVFLTAVVAVAVRHGLRPSLLGAIAGALAYDFFFIPPVGTLSIADPADVARLFLFLVLAALTAVVAARVRTEADLARGQAEAADALLDYGRRLAGAADVDELAGAVAGGLAALLGRDALVLLPEPDGTLRLRARSSAAAEPEPIELETARTLWSRGAWRRGEAVRLGSRMFYGLGGEGELVGLVGLSRDGERLPLASGEERLFTALAAQTASALTRLRMAAERDKAQRAAEGERLRSALLSSLSHDLRTPLASIACAASALAEHRDLYDEAGKAVLVATLAEETDRMARFVDNLLDMSRLEAGGVAPRREATDVGEIVDTALRRSAGRLAQHRTEVSIAPDLPLLALDGPLFEQALVNLLDNAAKYAPAGSTVSIKAALAEDGDTVLAVEDEGPGFPEGERERVFEKFHRAESGDGRQAGAGLGLAICRGFVEAMGGTIQAENRADRQGAVLTVRFPATAVADA